MTMFVVPFSRIFTAFAAALIAIGCAGALSAAANAADIARYVAPDGYDPHNSPPFSNAVAVGSTLYVAGHIGIDAATGQAATDAEQEARLVLDAVKHTLEKGGFKMRDLVSVTIYCTDLSLYDKFNAVYRSYFETPFPARAFIGVDKLVRGAHFEIAGVAVKATSGSRQISR